MVQIAKGHSVFIAHLQREATLLGESQVMGMRGPPPADKAGMRADESEMGVVPEPSFCADAKQALIDPRTGGDFGGPKWERWRRLHV